MNPESVQTTGAAGPASVATMAPPLDKSQLCARLGWSKPRLDRRIEADANFPIRSRGGPGGGWEFDLDVVLAYLAQTPAPRRGRPPLKAEPGPSDPAPAAELPAGASEHRGEATAKQRRDTMSAMLIEDKVKRGRGELLDREETRIVVSTALAKFSGALDVLPDQLLKLLALSDDRRELIRDLVDRMRNALVAELEKALG